MIFIIRSASCGVKIYSEECVLNSMMCNDTEMMLIWQAYQLRSP